ncbi:hypothetical protein [Schlesneria sp.]|uniref:hypothetical protein n=1 Tax=Schlesneria sp. TaxID=2762018 RepID=UPI002EF01BB9
MSSDKTKVPPKTDDESWKLQYLPDSCANNRIELCNAIRILRLTIHQKLGVSPVPDGDDPERARVTIDRIMVDCQWLNRRLPELLRRVGIESDGFPIPETCRLDIVLTARQFHKDAVAGLAHIQGKILAKIRTEDLPKHWQLLGEDNDPILPDHPITSLQQLLQHLRTIYDLTAGTDRYDVVCTTLANVNAYFFQHYTTETDRPNFDFSFDSMAFAVDELRRAISVVERLQLPTFPRADEPTDQEIILVGNIMKRLGRNPSVKAIKDEARRQGIKLSNAKFSLAIAKNR